MSIEATVRESCTTLRDKCTSFQNDQTGHYNKMVDHYNRQVNDRNVFQRIWDWIRDKLTRVVEAFNTLAGKIKEAAEWLGKEILDWVMGPVDLAVSWSRWQQVNELVARTTGGMSPHNLKVAIEWQGPAAAGYKATAEEQVQAGKVTSELVIALQDFIEKHLQGVVNYLLQCITQLADLYAAGAEAAIKFVGAASPTTWAEVLEGLSGLIATAIKTLGEQVKALVQFITEGIQSMADLKQQTLAAHQLPGGGGTWPPPYSTITAQPPAEEGGPKYPGWHQ
ncbi:hypothetical protein [Tessaracoccus sp. OH4464_COT-324]|uniref:hypothetical protein n=1 Tax=Tessaracoccus sp. OH4464_COT-324 TaxID=2491059 RepID=UPI000F6409D7|nr:hypothetical protein [Tessaracoccus sp. OH4464_COT-324]RRD46836.1 hypothetical protein EII42_05220 [Tessaracoccus sp. OH4464_COT-324]